MNLSASTMNVSLLVQVHTLFSFSCQSMLMIFLDKSITLMLLLLMLVISFSHFAFPVFPTKSKVYQCNNICQVHDFTGCNVIRNTVIQFQDYRQKACNY